MRSQIFRIRITDMLGIRHTIFCGGIGASVFDATYVVNCRRHGRTMIFSCSYAIAFDLLFPLGPVNTK